MILSEIIDKFANLKIYEQRFITDNYDELVFFNNELNEWNRIFVETLGSPIKPAGVEPTAEHLSISANYGGIDGNQTLFRKEFDAVTVVAMFWPWQDNVHTTLKVVVEGR